MTFKTHCQMSKGMVDPAPLVDVVFLLLLFFILSSPFVMQSGFGVLLPSSAAPPIASFQLVVTVTRDNLLFFNNQPMTIEQLGQSLSEAVQQGRGHELIIKADYQVTVGTIVQIRSVALRAGITSINEASRAEGSVPGSTR